MLFRSSSSVVEIERKAQIKEEQIKQEKNTEKLIEKGYTTMG